MKPGYTRETLSTGLSFYLPSLEMQELVKVKNGTVRWIPRNGGTHKNTLTTLVSTVSAEWDEARRNTNRV